MASRDSQADSESVLTSLIASRSAIIRDCFPSYSRIDARSSYRSRWTGVNGIGGLSRFLTVFGIGIFTICLSGIHQIRQQGNRLAGCPIFEIDKPTVAHYDPFPRAPNHIPIRLDPDHDYHEIIVQQTQNFRVRRRRRIGFDSGQISPGCNLDAIHRSIFFISQTPHPRTDSRGRREQTIPQSTASKCFHDSCFRAAHVYHD